MSSCMAIHGYYLLLAIVFCRECPGSRKQCPVSVSRGFDHIVLLLSGDRSDIFSRTLRSPYLALCLLFSFMVSKSGNIAGLAHMLDINTAILMSASSVSLLFFLASNRMFPVSMILCSSSNDN